MKKLTLLLFTAVILFSCEEEKSGDPATPFTASSGGIFISNEGNFQAGNSSISYFNPSNGNTVENAYNYLNSSALGDICQSMNLINGQLYLVVNNSGKIEVCDPYSLLRFQTITGLIAPRYIMPVNSSKAYVSDMISNYLTIINLSDNSIAGTIPLHGWTEQMIMKGTMMYVTNYSTEYLYIIDTSLDLVTDSVHISKGANSIVEDLNGKLWILCGGDYLQTFSAALYRIDPLTKQLEFSHQFSTTDFPSRLCINGTLDKLYFLNKHVFTMSISHSTIITSTFIASSNNSFYGLGVDKNRNEIYVSDAIDFIQRGRVFRYDAEGNRINDFLAGIIPGDFLFLP